MFRAAENGKSADFMEKMLKAKSGHPLLERRMVRHRFNHPHAPAVAAADYVSIPGTSVCKTPLKIAHEGCGWPPVMWYNFR